MTDFVVIRLATLALMSFDANQLVISTEKRYLACSYFEIIGIFNGYFNSVNNNIQFIIIFISLINII
jgi:hypothetical protein